MEKKKTKDSSSRSQLTQTQALRLTVTYSQIFDRLKAEETVNDHNSTKPYSQIDAKTNTLLLRPLRRRTVAERRETILKIELGN
jgi:hypothetical protein